MHAKTPAGDVLDGLLAGSREIFSLFRMPFSMQIGGVPPPGAPIVGFLGPGIPIYDMKSIKKAKRSEAIKAGRDATKEHAAKWAAGASERPYSLADLAPGSAKWEAAWKYFDSLSLADTKAECAMHGLPVTGSKIKLFKSLVKKADDDVFGNPNRGVYTAACPGPQKMVPASDSGKVRRALVADLRKAIVYDKKLKKGGNKMLRASYGSCGVEVWDALFPHAAGKKRASLELSHLEVDRLGKNLRYGESLEVVPGSLVATHDAQANTISVSGKYSMF